jgi:hypothetical protein
VYDFLAGGLLYPSRVLGGMIVSEMAVPCGSSFVRLRTSMVSSFQTTGVYSLLFKQAQAFLGGKSEVYESMHKFSFDIFVGREKGICKVR